MCYINKKQALDILEEEIEARCYVYTDEQQKYIDTGLTIALRDIKAIPTADVVEVVRCKDCVFVRGNEIGCFCGRLNPRMGHHVFDDDFCSYGERKEVE